MKRHIACGVCVLVLLAYLRSGAASFCVHTLLLVAYLKLQQTRSQIVECIVCGFVSLFTVLPMCVVVSWPRLNAALVPASMTTSIVAYHITKHKINEVVAKHEEGSFGL